MVGASLSGAVPGWRAFVIEDASLRGTPTEWARAALAARERHGATRIVAESNQGGEMVRAVLNGLDPGVPVTLVHAHKSKVARAEPVAALYEQGRVRHLRGLGPLEDQMARMTREGFRGQGSPDRVDALVWALTEALVRPLASQADPRLRRL